MYIMSYIYMDAFMHWQLKRAPSRNYSRVYLPYTYTYIHFEIYEYVKMVKMLYHWKKAGK